MAESNYSAEGLLNRARALIDELGISARIEPEVAEAISSDQVFGVACSGGVDSLAVLIWARAVFPNVRWVALHFDHGIRGASSQEDAAFVRDFANRLGIECVLGRGEALALAASEAELRDARMHFFSETVNTHSIVAILTGHHADDVVETFLMRAIRGVGAEGLSAPRPISSGAHSLRFYRPFLSLEKELLQSFLDQLGVAWREDETNGDPRYLRNALRSRVLPSLYAIGRNNGRDTRAMIGKSRSALQNDAEIVVWAVEQAHLHSQVVGGEELDTQVLGKMPVALVSKVVAHWLRENAECEPSLRVVDEIARGVTSGSKAKVAVNPHAYVIVDERVRITRVSSEASEFINFAPVQVWPGTEVFLPNAASLRLETRALTPSLLETISRGDIDESSEAWIDMDTLRDSYIAIRPRRAGDRYQVLGAPGAKDLKDIFNRRKIELSERKVLPIVCNSRGSILWVPGLPPAEQGRIHETTKLALRLTYKSL